MSSRSVAKIVKGYKVVDGAGVHLVRVLGPNTIKAFDPFLLLDAFDSKDPKKYLPGFPMHPHRGIETVTYLIHGVLNHKDSLGHEGVIHDGCCQWMTALPTAGAACRPAQAALCPPSTAYWRPQPSNTT